MSLLLLLSRRFFVALCCILYCNTDAIYIVLKSKSIHGSDLFPFTIPSNKYSRSRRNNDTFFCLYHPRLLMPPYSDGSDFFASYRCWYRGWWYPEYWYDFYGIHYYPHSPLFRYSKDVGWPTSTMITTTTTMSITMARTSYCEKYAWARFEMMPPR